MKKLIHLTFTRLLNTLTTLEQNPNDVHFLSIAYFQVWNHRQLFVWHCNEERNGPLIKGGSKENQNMEGVLADSNIYVRLLQGCVDMKAAEEGKMVHGRMITTGCETKLVLRNNLINMYAKCGCLAHARQVFDKMSERNVISWTAMIAGYAQQGHGEEALTLFGQMQLAGVKANQFTFGSVIRACTSLAVLEQGRQVHAHAIKTKFELDVFVGSALIDMYVKTTSLEYARQVFDKMPERDLVSWNAMIIGYSQHWQGGKALHLFEQIQRTGIEPNNVTYASVLSACMNSEDLEPGKQVHASIIKAGFESDVSVGNALVNMYAKCESIVDMCRVFERLPKQDVVSWSAMIAGYVHQGHGEEALKMFCEMQEAAMRPNQFTLASVLRACASLASQESGKKVHTHIMKTGFALDVFAATALVDMYAKCGSLENARQVFDKMLVRNVVSWNVMIAGYTLHACGTEALQLFKQMHHSGMRMNQNTFASVLSAFSSPEILEQGKQVHAHLIKAGSESDVFVGSALVDMYAKCGSIDYACHVFVNMPKRDVVSWTTMIAAHAQYGQGKEALELFWQMQCSGMKLNKLTFTGVLSSCACLSALEKGEQLHCHIIKSGFESDIIVKNSLVYMYAKCRSLKSAHELFYKMPKRDAVSWNVMTAGYAQIGCSEEAVKLFLQMQLEGVKPDEFSFASVLSACADLAAMEQGNGIHACIIKTGYGSNVIVGNTLVDMYSKCGSIDSAHGVFDKMLKRDLVSWTAMISGCAYHGRGKEALGLFEQMQGSGIRPNSITFVGVLSACSHVGLVNEGRHHFNSMSRNYNITPSMEHYACMVDLLGRAGYLDEAEDFINEMPLEPDGIVWRALLGACRTHGNMELGMYAAECILDLEPQDDATYVLLCNIYAEAGMWDDVAKVRKMMKDRGAKKEPGCSWIEVQNKMHVFIAGDRSHPQIEEIYAKLETLTGHMEERGYMPDIDIVLHGVEQNQMGYSYLLP